MNQAPSIQICMGSSCFARGNKENLMMIRERLKQLGLEENIELIGKRCEKDCKEGPRILIGENCYRRVDSSMLEELLQKHFTQEIKS